MSARSRPELTLEAERIQSNLIVSLYAETENAQD